MKATPADTFRLVGATLVCLSSVIAWAIHRSVHTAAPTTSMAPGGLLVYGDMLDGKLCQDEVRASPANGAWRCVAPQRLPPGVVVRTSRHDATNCSHRVLETSHVNWECWTRIPVGSLFLRPPGGSGLFAGDRPSAVLGHPPSRSSICVAENRDLLTHGIWSCWKWADLPRGARFVQAVDPGGPCSGREADPETGIWRCRAPDSELVSAG